MSTRLPPREAEAEVKVPLWVAGWLCMLAEWADQVDAGETSKLSANVLRNVHDHILDLTERVKSGPDPEDQG